MAGMAGSGGFCGWVGSEPTRGGGHSGGKGESWTRPKTRGSFICSKELIADRGISRHIGDGTFSNSHCGTATELNVIWIQRLIMKERSENCAQFHSNLRCRFETKGITYRCLVLPWSPPIIRGSLRWIITPAPPSNGRPRLLCGRTHSIGRVRIRGQRGGTATAQPIFLSDSEAVCCIQHRLRLSPGLQAA